MACKRHEVYFIPYTISLEIKHINYTFALYSIRLLLFGVHLYNVGNILY